MSTNCYSAGKGKGPSYSQGKSPNMTGAKVTRSAGQSSGTTRTGDKSGAPVMGKGKK